MDPVIACITIGRLISIVLIVGAFFVFSPESRLWSPQVGHAWFALTYLLLMVTAPMLGFLFAAIIQQWKPRR